MFTTGGYASPIKYIFIYFNRKGGGAASFMMKTGGVSLPAFPPSRLPAFPPSRLPAFLLALRSSSSPCPLSPTQQWGRGGREGLSNRHGRIPPAGEASF